MKNIFMNNEMNVNVCEHSHKQDVNSIPVYSNFK